MENKTTTDTVITIGASGDNYIYLCRYENNKAFAVDPSNAAIVIDALKKHSLNLTTIFITHHHFDHTGGIKELKNKTACEVFGPDKKRIPAIDYLVEDNDLINLADTKVQVIATPGHTETSVCYYIQPSRITENPLLWTGDTLFVNGCGRIFECAPQTMLESLLKLARLPDNTRIYPGHDYTLENYEFALSIQPDNQAVKKRIQEVKQLQRNLLPTVPSTISQEKATNPFLRTDNPEIKAALNLPKASAVDIFAYLRRQKDIF